MKTRFLLLRCSKRLTRGPQLARYQFLVDGPLLNNVYRKTIYQSSGGKSPLIVAEKPFRECSRQLVKWKTDQKMKSSDFNEKSCQKIINALKTERDNSEIQIPNPEIANTLGKFANLDIHQIKKMYDTIKQLKEIENQKYLPERTEVLGANIAALHYFTYRKAAVRLKDSDDWIVGDLEMLAQTLPNTYEKGYDVEAIDCSNFDGRGIRYEGLQNLTGLNSLKWLVLKNQAYIDCWCLDRIAGLTGKTLEYLDISSCKLNACCVYALAKMLNLHTLVVRDPGDDRKTQAALSFLECKRPRCIIKALNDKNLLVCADNRSYKKQ